MASFVMFSTVFRNLLQIHVRLISNWTSYCTIQGEVVRVILNRPRGFLKLLSRLIHKLFKKEHSETLFPAFLETKYQFPRQGYSSLKFSLKSKIINENVQMVGDGGGGIATTEFTTGHKFMSVSKFMRCFSENKL